MRVVRRWAHDLGLGIRLAVSGRGGPVRLGLIALGVGMGVAVLLVATSLVNVDDARNARENARIMQSDEFGEHDEHGGDGEQAALLARYGGTTFRGEYIAGTLFEAVGPEPPLPPGIDRIPEPGEVYLSPALADLLASPDGELLRPRFPWTVAGTIGDEGLVDPHELRFYAGAELSAAGDGSAETAESSDETAFQVFGFGPEDEVQRRDAGRLLLALSGGLLLLIPVFVLVGAATRIAAAARERRLAALRLVGADANQTRRIATGEALAGSVVGLLVGAGLFAAALPFAPQIRLFGYGAFREDVQPSVFGAVLIAMAVPALAVGAGLVALRHTVNQPLGATRQAGPPRRRLWWRLVPLLVGSALLAAMAGEGAENPSSTVQLVVLAGLALVGLSVPLLLPWLLQRAVGLLAGGPPSWQLAVRRLQLDSGTPARAAAGIAALLTAAVALQTLVATTLDFRPDGDDSAVEVYAGDSTAAVTAIPLLTDVEGVRRVRTYLETTARRGEGESFVTVVAGDCAALSTEAQLDACAAGDAFVVGADASLAGEELVFQRWSADGEEVTEAGRWSVPTGARPVEVDEGGTNGPSAHGQQTIMLAARAMPDAVPSDLVRTRASVEIDPADRDVVERMRNVLLPVEGSSVQAPFDPAGDDFTVQLRNALLAGSVIVLALAAASMLIVSVEQVRERRQQLAALAASGVPTRTLGGSVFWQSFVPFIVAAASAAVVGSVLAWLFLRVFDTPVAIDWDGIGLLTAGCALAVLVVTALTLPSLRAATRPESLQTE